MNHSGPGGISIFGVAAFVVGILALAALIIRRDNKKPLSATDYGLMFLGIAGAIVGLAVLFLRF